MSDWGWRIPFLIGAVLSACALYLRRTMDEPAVFTRARAASSRRGDLKELLRYPRELFTVLALTAGGTVSFYCFTTYMQKYLVNTTGFSIDDATLISSLALLVFIALQPLVGWLSDLTGRRPMLITFGVLGTLFTVPILSALAEPQSFSSALGWYLAGVLITTGYTSINAIFKAELFPVHVRALGVALPFAIARLGVRRNCGIRGARAQECGPRVVVLLLRERARVLLPRRLDHDEGHQGHLAHRARGFGRRR